MSKSRNRVSDYLFLLSLEQQNMATKQGFSHDHDATNHVDVTPLVTQLLMAGLALLTAVFFFLWYSAHQIRDAQTPAAVKLGCKWQHSTGTWRECRDPGTSVVGTEVPASSAPH